MDGSTHDWSVGFSGSDEYSIQCGLVFEESDKFKESRNGQFNRVDKKIKLGNRN
jgi:hypothetical protein